MYVHNENCWDKKKKRKKEKKAYTDGIFGKIEIDSRQKEQKNLRGVFEIRESKIT